MLPDDDNTCGENGVNYLELNKRICKKFHFPFLVTRNMDHLIYVCILILEV